MEIYPLIQTRLLLLSALLGAIVGALCDALKLIHGEIKAKRVAMVWRFLGDFFTVGTSVVGIALLNYKFNRGIVRAFPFLGYFFGFFVYKHTVSYLVRPLMRWSFNATKMICRVFLYPFVIFLKFLVKILEKIKYYMNKTLEKIFVLVYNIYVRKTILKAARKGFIKKRGR